MNMLGRSFALDKNYRVAYHLKKTDNVLLCFIQVASPLATIKMCWREKMQLITILRHKKAYL